MARPKNTVTITKANKQGSQFDIWFDSPQGRVKFGRRSTATILKALRHWDNCQWKDDF